MLKVGRSFSPANRAPNRREMQQSGLNLARFLKKPRLVSAKRLQKRAKFWPAAWR
jgi:hypothetical protein